MKYPNLPGPCPPRPGDILFQHTSEEPRRAAISRIFPGVHNFVIDHVALCVTEGEVVEAVPPCVRQVPLQRFLKNSHRDKKGLPRVLVCRVSDAGDDHIETAVTRAVKHIGMPYNETYMPCTKSWYCSSLVMDAWQHAHSCLSPHSNRQFFFKETPLEFRDPATGFVMEFWKEYYQEREMDVPQGLPGSHPALLSRSEALEVVGSYGTFQQLKHKV